jgi:uncharacterized protein
MLKPRGAICDLECAYCYYLEKEKLYPGSRFRMSEETLERFTRQYIEASPVPEAVFGWQGGEPTLMGLEFFERAVELQQRYARKGMRVLNTLQTNGMQLTDDWCRFLKKHGFLVGISIDGPSHLHDVYRLTKGGMPTFDDVMAGLALLRKHGVEYNVLTTLHAANGDHPLDVYHFVRDETGTRFVQFIPIVERVPDGGGGVTVGARSVGARQYGDFLIAVFDEWVRRDVGTMYVQIFDVALAQWVGHPPGLCVFDAACGDAMALEHTGDLYCCDHFVDPDHLLGNVIDTPLVQLAGSEAQQAFGSAKRDALPQYCRECEVRFACNGGCPKDRFIRTPDGEAGLNYLCEGYKAFFDHVAPAMRYMAAELRAQRPPATIMNGFAERVYPQTV